MRPEVPFLMPDAAAAAISNSSDLKQRQLIWVFGAIIVLAVHATLVGSAVLLVVKRDAPWLVACTIAGFLLLILWGGMFLGWKSVVRGRS